VHHLPQHGTTNADLVLEAIKTPTGEAHTIVFHSDAGLADGSFASASAPGTGVCEVCHDSTTFYRADGTGLPHFTGNCLSCHTHAHGFEAEITPQSCPACHSAEADRFALPSQHSARFQCVDCHAEVSPRAGPGHRSIPACTTCHDQKTHSPNGTGFPCTTCHDPHGTTNANLVLEAITSTADGLAHPIVFDNIDGLADGSFASASAPGTGICEICHTTTQFYRADGTGAPHFTVSCLPCHRHSDGFAPIQ
jgi:predicted CXXCH cytochrome family protein